MPEENENITGQPNNEGGNPAPDSNAGGDANNAGQALNPEQFWTGQPNDGGSNDSEISAEEFGRGIAQEIANYQGVEIFTPDIAAQVAQGDLAGVNQAMQAMQRQAIQQAVVIATNIMRRGLADVESRFDTRVQSHLGSEKNQQALMEEFPSMRDPAMAPVIQGVFAQAMIHTKNDRTKALEMTRGMLRVMGKSGSKDFGISDPPQSQENPGSSHSLVAELLGKV